MAERKVAVTLTVAQAMELKALAQEALEILREQVEVEGSKQRGRLNISFRAMAALNKGINQYFEDL